MKNLIALALLILPLAAKAQTTTNLAWRVQVETVTAGVTNTVTTNWRYDWGVNTKDGLKISGLAFAYNNYLNSGAGTNAFGQWLKTDVGDRAKAYQDVKEAADNTTLVQKLTSLLLQNPDLLTPADLNDLQTIAAKAP